MVSKKPVFIVAIVAIIMVSVDIALWLLATNGVFSFSLFIYSATIFNLLLVIFTRIALRNTKRNA